MKNRKSTKTFADNDCNIFSLIKANGQNSYFMEVLYYYVRRTLLEADFDLSEYDGFNTNGKYLGYKVEVNFSNVFNNVIQSLSFALSVRALLLNPTYFQYCYDSRLLFFTMTDYLTWESHRIIMECINDEDFRFIYQMIVDATENGKIDDNKKQLFKEGTIRPEFHHLEDYCKLMAKDPEYNGISIIKNNAYLCSDIEEFTITKAIDYVGNTVFAYCDNLKEIRFERKVLFGKFPIIECKNLKRIVVPTDLLDYYKESLPYFKDIITDRELEIEEPDVEEKTDDLEIEHVYVGIPSADSYIETDVETDESEETIDFSTIEKVFDKKATSYKYFWFMAIISLAKEKDKLELPYNDILIRMAALAWPIVMSDGIDLGKNDLILRYLNDIQKNSYLINDASIVVVESYLRDNYDTKDIGKILSPLLKNVPFRFLSPWIKYTTDEEVVKKSLEKSTYGFYELHEDHIIINKVWWNYIEEHYDDICNFTLQSFISYVKQNNKSTKLLKLMEFGWLGKR